MNRRRFLGLAALAPALAWRQDAAQDSLAARPLMAPELAGRPRNEVTDYQNDPAIIAIERRIQCTCPCTLDVYTCRTTDFTCTYSPAMHREVVALYEGGKSAQEILDAFVERYGETVLMAPEPAGFNWAGYLLPGTLILAVGGSLGWVLMRRHRVAGAEPAAAASAADPLSSDDRSRLADELDRLDT